MCVQILGFTVKAPTQSFFFCLWGVLSTDLQIVCIGGLRDLAGIENLALKNVFA